MAAHSFNDLNFPVRHIHSNQQERQNFAMLDLFLVTLFLVPLFLCSLFLVPCSSVPVFLVPLFLVPLFLVPLFLFYGIHLAKTNLRTQRKDYNYIFTSINALTLKNDYFLGKILMG